MKNKIGRIISTIFISILALLLLAIVGLYLAGYRGYAVLTGSMTPEIRQGALVFSKQYDENEILDNLEIGDDITYQTATGTTVTHRIIAMDEEAGWVQTQGIKEGSTIDAPIEAANILGKVKFHIPLIGYLVILLKNIYFDIILGLIIVVIVVAKALVKELKKEKIKKEE